MTRLVITQRRSAIGEKEAARGTLRALGLTRPGTRVHHEDGPQVRGMLRKVAHLVDVSTATPDGDQPAGRPGRRSETAS